MASDLITSGEIDFRDSKVGEMKEYDLVDEWTDIPEELLYRNEGWGRRPTRDEGLYGPTYTSPEIVKIVADVVRAGNDINSERKGQSQVSELIQEKYPGMYCVPGDTENSKTIASEVERQRKAKGGNAAARREPKLPKEITDKLRELMKEHPSETGSPIEKRLSRFYGTRKPAGYDRKEVMNRVNTWRAAKKRKEAAQRKRRLIG
jgi:hypothetical protein